MKDPRSLRTYLERKILRHSIYVLVILCVFSIVVSYGVSRIKTATDIEDSAAAVSKAYRSRILEGDIKVSQTQLHELLHLGADEQVLILNQNKEQIYQDTVVANAKIEICPTDGQACFDYKTARILLPIHFDLEKKSLYGYIYLSRNIRVDWFFVALTFSIFFVGYLLLYFGFSNLIKNAAGKLSNEISLWAKRLEDNPKDVTTLSRAPFSELNTLKKAIEGLNSKIQGFENQAGHKAKLLVLRGIAHDLLGPVAQMQFHLASLKTMPLNIESSEVINDLTDSLKRISAIATQVKLLDHKSDEFGDYDLSELVSTEIKNLKSLKAISELGLKLEFEGESNLKPQVSKSEICRIVQNLVLNSAQASNSGGNIEISVKRENDNAAIQVRDHGCGIPQHLQEQVFEPDYTSKPGVGTGLGLSIVQHICHQRGGTVTLESDVGSGTSVRVAFPLGQEVIHAT